MSDPLRTDGSRAQDDAPADRGAPTDEALAVLERLNRLETAAPPAAVAPAEKTRRRRAAHAAHGSSSSIGGAIAATLVAVAAVTVGGWAAWSGRVDWRAVVA